MDPGLYSALAGVAAITTGVQVAVSTPATVMTWQEVDAWGVAEAKNKQDKDRQRWRTHAMYALAVVLFGALVNGTAILGWILEVPTDAGIGMILPMVGVALTWFGCLLAGLLACRRSLRTFRGGLRPKKAQ